MLVPPLLLQDLPRAVPCVLLEMHLQLQLEVAHACAGDVAAALYRAGGRLAPLDLAAGEDGCDGHEDGDNAVDDGLDDSDCGGAGRSARASRKFGRGLVLPIALTTAMKHAVIAFTTLWNYSETSSQHGCTWVL